MLKRILVTTLMSGVITFIPTATVNAADNTLHQRRNCCYDRCCSSHHHHHGNCYNHQNSCYTYDYCY